MNITSKIKSLVLGAAILPAILWAKPGDPLRFTSTRAPAMLFDKISLNVAADADPKPVFEIRMGCLDGGSIVWEDWQPWDTSQSIMVRFGSMMEVRAATDSVQKISGFDPISSYTIENCYSTFSFYFSKDTTNGLFKASGDVTTLLCRGGTDTVGEGGLAYLFRGCGWLLKSAPELPAVNLSTFCYAWMFEGTSIETPPALPAERLADRCYLGMFASCANLKSAPELRATELDHWCYKYMFSGCSSLTAAPALPATKLTDQCYRSMFKGCSSLTAAPDLPATTLAGECYDEMFWQCSQLAAAPAVLPAAELLDRCYHRMFSECSSLTAAPALPAKTMKPECYSEMFDRCESLAVAPDLPAEVLASRCYACMFRGCKALSRAPALPAKNVVWGCYDSMFSGCTSLTEAPLLPAEYLSYEERGVYANMFNGCTSLTNVTLKAKYDDWHFGFLGYCFENWLSGVAPHGIVRCPASLPLRENSESGLPVGWVRETIVPPSPISGVEPAYDFVAGAPIEPIVPTVDEGWTVKVAGLPSGLKAASNTGVVSGKPTKVGTFQVTFTATKSGEDSVSVTAEITVWKTYTVTFGAAGMRAEASDAEGRFAPVSVEGAKGAKLAAVGNGQTVTVTAPETSVDKKGNELVFQKWTVSPSSVVLSGEGYCVQSNAVSFLMPEANVTLTPTYVEAAKCGWLTAYGRPWVSMLLENDEWLEPDVKDMQWSPDGGKTWYVSGECAMLAAGTYTVQCRSASPLWAAPKDKKKGLKVEAGKTLECKDDFWFDFVPNVVVDLRTPDGGVPEGCTATMNPKDGRVPDGKSVTLTAKPSKDYAFQGWYLRLWDYWDVEPILESVSTSYKLVNELDPIGIGFLTDSWYISPEDYKVHMIAKFKAVKDYRQEDLISNFNGIGGTACSEVRQIDDEHVELTVYGMTGCALDYDIETGEDVWPLTFKQASGKLPKGLKFDAKKGKVSGTPTAKGGESVSCVFTIMDPAKNVLNVTVNFEIRPLRDGLAGDYRALVHLPWSNVYDENDHYLGDKPGKPDGLLEMSVTAAGKISAKILHQLGSTSFSGTLAWRPDENDPAKQGSMGFDFIGKKNADFGFYAFLRGDFNDDGTVTFDWSVADYGAEGWIQNDDETAYRQDKDLYEKSVFREKYYTFAFGTTNAVDEANSVEGGYGYLTVKTDKKGVAKVAGKLPDGTAVSANALVLPFAPTGEEATAENITARLFFFNVPSAYKKQGWCAMDLALDPSGDIGLDLSDPQAAAWFQASTYLPPASAYCDWDDRMYPTEWEIASSLGAFYSPAATLTNYYWCAVCPADERVAYEYKCKSGSESWNEMAAAQTFDGTLFAVELAGDKKGSVVLREKSPAPWKNKQGEWVYDEDKNGKPITDPSQLSISFTKATGIFSGKTNFYFDYNDGSKDQHQKVSVPYAGVMVDSSDGLLGFGSAVFSNKRTGTYEDYRNGQEKSFSYTEKIPLPVVLAPFAQE